MTPSAERDLAAIGIPRSLWELAWVQTDAQAKRTAENLRRELGVPRNDGEMQVLDEATARLLTAFALAWIPVLWEARQCDCRMPADGEDLSEWMRSTFLPAYWRTRGVSSTPPA